MQLPRLPFLRRWTHKRETDYFDLSRIACRTMGDYVDAVDCAASRHELATILTGLAGCELAMSRAEPLMAWLISDDPAQGDPTITQGQENAIEMRRSGLILLEVAHCAAQGNEWDQSLLWRTTQNVPLHNALRDLAVAYGQCEKPGDMTGEVDVDIAWALHALCDVQPTESLGALMRAHGHDYRANKYAELPMAEPETEDLFAEFPQHDAEH